LAVPVLVLVLVLALVLHPRSHRNRWVQAHLLPVPAH
jgi:hypothetical protein